MSSESYMFNSLQELIEQHKINGLALTDYENEIRALYLENTTPWVIGYSGGKDSTVVLELVYQTLLNIAPQKRHKSVFVVCSDTLVETPVVVNWIKQTLEEVNQRAKLDGLPLTAHQVTPRIDKTFWVNLLGKGYPAPTPMFRWCTENMKINPVSEFIKDKVSKYGEVIVILGARKEESSTRAQVIARHRIEGSRLNKHNNLPNAFVYTPIEDWTADDVWLFLMGAQTPWGTSNRTLFELYKDSNQGECPLVIDTSTPSCGNSRFGCWTCTVVTKDKAMESLIESGETWMQRLSDFRNMLTLSNDEEKRHELRSYKRRTGKITFYSDNRINQNEQKQEQFVRGPLLMDIRKAWLKELLTIEKGLKGTPNEIELITRPELHQIRQEWLNDPNQPDWSDALPQIYREVYGSDLEWVENDSGAFTAADAELLEELAEKYSTSPHLIMKLLDLELSMDSLSHRSGIFKKIASILKRDWDELENIVAEREKIQDRTEYKRMTRSLIRSEGNKEQGKHRNIFDEVSDRLSREQDHYTRKLIDLEELHS